MIADTSQAARRAVEAGDGISAGCERVMLWLHRHPGQSFTRAEIAQGASMKLQTVCARVRDLLDDDRKRIEELPARPCSVTGNPSKPLRVAGPKAATQVPRTVRPGDDAELDSRVPATVESRTSANLDPAPAAAPGSALDIAQRRAAQAQANRGRMPGVTALVEKVRQYFPDARVRYAMEGDVRVGHPGDVGVVAVVAPAAKPKQRRAA